MSSDAHAANVASGSVPKRPLDDEDELQLALEEALNEIPDLTIEPKDTKVDSVMTYHRMIRLALVDWGDEIIDVLVAKFAKNPKLVAHIEETRKELIDPLRNAQ